MMRILNPILLSLGALALAAAFFLYFGINYNNALDSIRSQDFHAAETSINKMFFIAEPLTKMHAYINAGLLLDSGNYDGAIAAFSELGNYESAVQCAIEAKYQKAAVLADNASFDEAIYIYEEINGYKDSNTLITETNYRKACYLVEHENRFSDALTIFKQLAKEGYKDSGDKVLWTYYNWGEYLTEEKDYIEAYEKYLLAGKTYNDVISKLIELKSAIYSVAIQNYRIGKYYVAQDGFSIIHPYQKTREYLILTVLHTASSCSVFTYTQALDYILEIVGFEDGNDIILNDTNYAWEFLEGKWKNGSYYLNMDNKGMHCYIPAIDFGDEYDFRNGSVYFVKSSTGQSKLAWDMEIVTVDCIKIYSYYNNETYTLFRR